MKNTNANKTFNLNLSLSILRRRYIKVVLILILVMLGSIATYGYNTNDLVEEIGENSIGCDYVMQEKTSDTTINIYQKCFGTYRTMNINIVGLTWKRSIMTGKEKKRLFLLTGLYFYND